MIFPFSGTLNLKFDDIERSESSLNTELQFLSAHYNSIELLRTN